MLFLIGWSAIPQTDMVTARARTAIRPTDQYPPYSGSFGHGLLATHPHPVCHIRAAESLSDSQRKCCSPRSRVQWKQGCGIDRRDPRAHNIVSKGFPVPPNQDPQWICGHFPTRTSGLPGGRGELERCCCVCHGQKGWFLRVEDYQGL